MEEVISKLTIEPAQNGFLVYTSDFQSISGMSVRKIPFVFETMDHLLEFIKNSYDSSK